MLTRRIATPPGQPDQVVTLSAADESAVLAKRAVNEITGLKETLRARFEDEMVVRAKAQVPEFDNIETLKAVAGLWPSIGAGAPAAQKASRDIFVFARATAIPKVDAMTTAAQLRAVDPELPDPFGDGTTWPA